MPSIVRVAEPDDTAFHALQSLSPGVRRASLEEVASADLLFLALHPPALVQVLPVLGSMLTRDVVVVSLAPKVSLEALTTALGTRRVARMIPNAPSIIGQGYNPVAFGPGLNAAARAELGVLFAAWGEAPDVEEQHLEAYAVLTGMGPTYLWFQWQTLREIASELRLPDAPRDAALRAMVTGALATLLDTGLSPSAVMDLVPVKPLAASEAAIVGMYREALPALHAKIRSVAAASV
jgi:pyrroline-5-carboxylate reductase